MANVGIGVKGGVPLVGPSGFIEARYAYDVDGFGDEGGDDVEINVRANVFMIRAGIGL